MSLDEKEEETMNPFDLECSLLRISSKDSWRLRDAVEGVAIFGQTGSGKTTASETMAKKFLINQYNGLVLTAKNSETKRWIRYAKESGREGDLIIFSPENPWRFNFLNYELTRMSRGGGDVSNLADCFSTVMEISEKKNYNNAADRYWHDAVKQILKNSIEILARATGEVSLPQIYRLVSTAPQNAAQVHEKQWQDNSFCFEMIAKGEEDPKGKGIADDFDLACTYFLREFAGLGDRHRSSIISCFSTLSDTFLRGTLKQLFSTATTITPEAILEQDKILIIDLPVKEYGHIGRVAQVMWKYFFQQAVERRSKEGNPIPVFLWCDEAQFFVVNKDRDFQSTARESRCCTVYLSQNLSSYYAELGGESSKHDIEALMGNMLTKIFHANSHADTNDWAAHLISRSYQMRSNFGRSGGQDSARTQVGQSESLDYKVLPEEFLSLRNGGPDNDYLVDAILFQSGRQFKIDGKRHLRVSFKQQI